eukprot:3757461-Amphidinium_carterae.1
MATTAELLRQLLLSQTALIDALQNPRPQEADGPAERERDNTKGPSFQELLIPSYAGDPEDFDRYEHEVTLLKAQISERDWSFNINYSSHTTEQPDRL